MKRIFILLLVINISLINYSQIIADHTVVDKFDDIPLYYIDQVKKMWISYPGESHSESIRRGLELLEAAYPAYQVKVAEFTDPAPYTTAYLRADANTWGDLTNTTGWIRWYGEEDWYASAAAIAQTKAGIIHCNTIGPALSAIGFGMCYGDGGGSYITATQSYIDYCTANGYPTKVFFTTGPVDESLHLYEWTSYYDAIRHHVASDPTLILFDFADILCYNNDGSGPNTTTDEGHTVPYITTESHIPDVGGFHFSNAGALRLAKAMWWLLARIAGWDGGYTWQGGISNNFAKPTNWKESAVPPDGSNITFASDVSNPCILDRDRTLGNINISQAAYGFSVDGKKLTITGNLNLSGGAQIDATLPGSVIVFSGSKSQNIPSGAFTGNTVDNVIINNPAGLSVNGNLTISGLLTINSGSLLSVSPATGLTVSGNLSNNGTLNLNSDATGIFSLMMNSYSGSGTANINMYLTGGWGGGEVEDYKWHYVAVPADYVNDKSVFTSIDANNLLKYDDAIIPDDNIHTSFDGWIWHDGWTTGTTGPPPYTGPKFSDLKVRTGYNFYHSNTSSLVSFRNLSSLQTSLGIIQLQYSGENKINPSNYGFNLLGNSLTCGIDWNLVTNETGNPADVVYFTINNKLGAYLNGAPDGINGATKNIPPLQGFFVKTSSSGTSLNFSAAREHTIQPRYKKGSISDIPFIKLELNKSGNQDETLIWFNDKATNLFDCNYDAIKLFVSANGYDQIYTCFGTTRYGINGLCLPAETILIPLGVKVNAPRSDYKILASQITGLDNYKVTLSDKQNSNFTVDLKKTDRYTFSSESGTFEDRFYLTITNDLSDLPSVPEAQKAFNIFVFENVLNIEVLNSEWEGNPCTIDIFDLAGKKVLWESNIKCYTGDLKQIPLNISDGIYIVRIKEEARVWVSKIPVF